MERVEWILCTTLLFLSLPILPAADEGTHVSQNFTTAVIRSNSTITDIPSKDVTTASLETESTINTFASVTGTMSKPNMETITPGNAPFHQTSASVPEHATATTTLTTDHETTALQVSTSDAQASNSETEMLTSPVSAERPVDLTSDPSQDILTTNLQTTPQVDLTSVRLYISTRQMEDLSPTAEPHLTSSKSQTEKFTAKPPILSIAPVPQTTHSQATSPATTHSSTSTVSMMATSPATTHSSTSIVSMGEKRTSKLSWVILVALLSGVVLIGALYCLCLLIRRKRRSRTEYLGSSFRIGKASKRKKGAEQDTWAGPVKLGAGEKEEAEGGGEDRGPEDDKREGGGVEVVLSTFTANEGEKGGPDGGLGMAGSRESKRWEEEEPLLYIDEGVVDEPERMSPEKDMEGGEGNGPHFSDNDKSEQNGGAAFCLTTAV
ncbi:mucin-3A isoform X2 [Esox lucius]|nr:mucin-3A isoform X2 [Esox lucius]